MGRMGRIDEMDEMDRVGRIGKTDEMGDVAEPSVFFCIGTSQNRLAGHERLSFYYPC